MLTRLYQDSDDKRIYLKILSQAVAQAYNEVRAPIRREFFIPVCRQSNQEIRLQIRNTLKEGEN